MYMADWLSMLLCHMKQKRQRCDVALLLIGNPKYKFRMTSSGEDNKETKMVVIGFKIEELDGGRIAANDDR